MALTSPGRSAGGSTARHDLSTQRTGASSMGGAGGAARSSAQASLVQCMRFGDIVQVYCEDVDSPSSSTSAGGFMGADGFADAHCDIRRVKEGMETDIADNLFLVTPKLQSQCQKKLSTSLTEALEKADWNPNGTPNLDPDLKVAIERLRAEAHSESMANAYEVERSLGQVVNYGQMVQLCHIKSGKLLTIRSKEVAHVESQCQRVCLSEHGGIDAWWSMEPRYRAMGIGEPVRYNDSVSILSGKVNGAMLHAAKEATVDAALSHDPCEYFEVNCFNVDVKTTWKFRSFTPYQRNRNKNIMGGDIVQLLHVELDALLAHADAPLDVETNSVFLRKKDSMVPANTLWRIEQEKVWDGSTCFFDGKCRLRHLLTGQYLALRRDVSVVKTNDEQYIADTVLQLSGTGAHRAGSILGEQLVYVMGSKRESFLHAQAGKRSSATAVAVVSATLQSSDALRIIKVRPRHIGDFYRVASARTALHRFLELEHMSELQANSQSYAPPLKTRFTIGFATRVIADMAEFVMGKQAEEPLRELLTGEKREQHVHAHHVRHRRQTNLREHGLLDDLTDTTEVIHKKLKVKLGHEQSIIISQSPRRADPSGKGNFIVPSSSASGALASARGGAAHGADGAGMDPHAALQLYSTAHKALQAAMTESRANVEHLRDFVNNILVQMSGGPRLLADARSTLHVMLSCDSVLKETIPLNVIETFLCGIDTDPPARQEYVECLSKLLTNHGKGVRRNQDIILQRWLLDKRRSLLIFDTFSPESNIVQVRVRAEALVNNSDAGRGPAAANAQAKSGTRTLAAVRVIDLEALTSSQQDQDIYKLYLAQLDMLQKLCIGNNEEARDTIGGPRKHVTYDALLQCICNERLPANLRCLYTRLMLHLYVARPKVDRMRNHDTFVLDELGDGEELPRPKYESDHEMHNKLALDVLHSMKGNASFNVPEYEEGDSELSLAFMELMEEMTALGYYNETSVLQSQLIPPVISLLDYTSDHIVIPVDPRNGNKQRVQDRHVMCPENRAMMKAKTLACQLLHLVCDLRLQVRIRRILVLAKGLMFENNTKLGRRANSMLFSMMSFSGTAYEATSQAQDSATETAAGGKKRKGKGGVTSVQVVADLAADLREGATLDRLHGIVNFMGLVDHYDRHRFSRILLDLLQCQKVELAQQALSLMIREHTPKMELFLKLFDTQLLRPPQARRDYHAIQSKLDQLHELIIPFKMTLVSGRSTHRLKAPQRDQVVALLKDLKELCTPSTELTSEMQARSFMNKEIMRRSCADEVVIEMLCECMTPLGDPNGEFVGAKLSLTGSTEDNGKGAKAHEMSASAMHWLVHEFLPTAFEFLEHYSRGMPRNQMRVSRHVILIASFLRWGVAGVPQALAGIYENNRALCEQMDKAVIEIVVDFLAYGPQRDAASQKPRRLPGGGSSFNQVPSRRGGESGSFMVQTATPVFDVWCLRFLETAFNVQGKMVRRNQQYILHCLVQHGPQNLTLTPEERRSFEYSKDGDGGSSTGPGALLLDQDGNKKELALQLFRGREGARVRERARKARAGVEDPMQDVLEYNVSLLRLLSFLSLDQGPSDVKVLRSLFDPGDMAKEVIGTSVLGRAKAEMLNLFCILYLRQGMRATWNSKATNTAIWTMLEYLHEQLKIADASALAGSMERSHGGDTLALPPMRVKGLEAQKRANAELELLLAERWAPMLDAVLSNTSIMQVMTVANRATLDGIFGRLVALLELVSQQPDEDSYHDTPRPLDEIKVKETFVTVQALLKKLASMDHPPIRVQVSPGMLRDMDDIAYELHEREKRKKPKLPRYTYQRPQEPTVSLVTQRKLQCFAQAFLNTVDPIIEEGAAQEHDEEKKGKGAGEEEEECEEEEEEEDEEQDGLQEFAQPEVRLELVKLCRMFTDMFSLFRSMDHFKDNMDTDSSGNVILPTESVVGLISTFSRDDMSRWECQTMTLLRIVRGLVLNWQNSVSDSLPPPWILHGIPKMVIDLIGMTPTSDRVTMMALDLAIVNLQVSPPWPVQQAFYEALVASGRAASEFMGMLLDRIRRGEDEALDLRRFYDQLNMNLNAATGPADRNKMLEVVQAYEGRIRGQARCLHTQLVQAMRGEVRAASHVEAIFRFLQLLCEGHNLRWQNYLRAQNNGIRNVDLVTATANYVIFCAPHICPLTVQVPVRALQSLAEFVQNPCRANQRVLVDTALVASANNILNINNVNTSGNLMCQSMSKLGKDVTEMSSEMMLQLVQDKMEESLGQYPPAISVLKSSTITCLLSLLECVDEPYIPGRMLETLDSGALRDNMNNLLLKYSPELVLQRLADGDITIDNVWIATGRLEESAKIKEDLKQSAEELTKAKSEESAKIKEHLVQQAEELTKEERDEALEVAQNFYITYITLASFQEQINQGDSSFQDGMTCEKIWDIDSLRKTVGAIEISRDGVLEKAYFIVPPLCRYLTHETKQAILVGVNRANLQTMLTGFSESFDSLYEEMRHQRKLTESKLLNFFRVTALWREKVFFYNAILINILLLLFYNYECNKTFICGDNEDLVNFRIKPGWRELVVVLSCVQCLFAITRHWWYVIERAVPWIQAQIVENAKRPYTASLWSMMVWLPPGLADPVRRINPAARGQTEDLASVWRLHMVQLLYLLSDLKFWTITAQTVVSVLALLIKHEGAKLLLLVHMLEIFSHSVVLQNVMRSITYRGNTLLQTAGLALVMIYFFGVLGFMLFPDLFQFAEADIMGGRKLDPNNNGARCTSIWKCSLVVLDMGLRKGDLGEAMDDIGWGSGNLIFYRMIYTLLFFIMVSTILMNIIFGVIIDTFAELRARKDEIDRDISGRCFICGIERFVFDQLGDGSNGFETHLTNDHNMWKYLYFQVYLRTKAFDSYSGGESYVFSKTLELVRNPETHQPIYDPETDLELKRPSAQIDLLWFPQKAAMRLKNQKPSVEQQMQDKIKSIENNIQVCADRLNAQMDKVSEAAATNEQGPDTHLSSGGVPRMSARQRSWGQHV